MKIKHIFSLIILNYYLSSMKHFIILFLFISSFCFGQFGWTNAEVALKDGTVLRGQAKITKHRSEGLFKIKLWRKRDKLKFRKEKGANKFKYKAEEIEYVIFYNKKYTPVYLKKGKGKPVFMKEIVKGDAASLYCRLTKYSYNDGSGYVSGGNVEEYWVDKPELEKMFHLIAGGSLRLKSFKNRLLDLFGDCESLISPIKNKEYKKADLSRLVKDYNACKK